MFRYSLKVGDKQSFAGYHLSSTEWYYSKEKIEDFSSWSVVLEEEISQVKGIKPRMRVTKTEEEIKKYKVKTENITEKIMKKVRAKTKGVDKNAK